MIEQFIGHIFPKRLTDNAERILGHGGDYAVSRGDFDRASMLTAVYAMVKMHVLNELGTDPNRLEAAARAADLPTDESGRFIEFDALHKYSVDNLPDSYSSVEKGIIDMGEHQQKAPEVGNASSAITNDALAAASNAYVTFTRS
jgi:hypothetical protein